LSLKNALQQDIDNKINHTHEFEFSLVYDLVETLRYHFLDIKITRGNYDKAIGRQVGVVPDFVALASREVTGVDQKHDKNLQIIVKDIRKFEASR
jgi:hypothetical protein